jgi:hypothetical protein
MRQDAIGIARRATLGKDMAARCLMRFPAG